MRMLLQIFITIIPLIVSFSTFDPTLTIRFLIFSLVVSGILLYYLIANKSINREVIMHPTMIAFGIMILAYLFSAFFNGFGSESIYVILKLFLSYVFAIILIQFVITDGYKPLLNSVVYFSLFLSATYFLLIITNYSEIMSIEDNLIRNSRFDNLAAKIGGKNLVSSLQFLVLPILVYVITIGNKAYKVLSSLGIVFILVILFLTQTRSVLFAVVIFSVSLYFLNKKSLKRKYPLIILTVSVLGSGYAIMKYTNRYDAFVGEIKKTLDFSSSTRYKLYKSSCELIGDHLFIGVGPGNWKINISEYGIYNGGKGESFALRPHNDFLWVFAEGGFIAGISYILLFIILLRDSYYLHENRTEKDDIFYSLLFSAFLGFGFISLFDFPLERFSHNIIFFVLASFVIAVRVKEPKKKMPYWFKVCFLLVSFFASYVASIRYIGEVHTKNAIHFKQKGNWNYVIKSINKGYHPIYYEMENTSTPLLWYRGVAHFNQQSYDLALHDFKKAYEINAYHVYVLNNLATSYEIKGEREKAKKYYTDAFKVNQRFKEARVNFAAILYSEQKYTEALDMILNSKFTPYWKRRKENDNFDLYLKTIVNGWVNSIINNKNSDKKEMLNRLLLDFENKPKETSFKTLLVFKKRKEFEIDYLNALILVEEDYKQRE